MIMKNKGLDRTQLKIIAIISMVIDHIAWGFVDFYSPLGQFLHVCGRLTVPIMCFFIAEGFRKTSDRRRYIYRMAAFAAASVIPFYIFFHEEYDYRQNFIFDLMLGLLLLTVLESGKLKKWAKVLLTILLFGISATVGGWIITPLLFILAFYYGRTFKQKAVMFAIADVATVLFLMVAIYINNNVYHFAKYEWLWWDKTYLLGFMLALPLLYMYNGKKGKEFGGRYFFYLFYPLHFLVLSLVRYFTGKQYSPWGFYLGLHIAGLVMVLIVTFLTIRAKHSRGQMSVLMIEFGALIYVLGFILEVLSNTVEGVHFACIVQYFGEYILFIAVIFFVSVLCSKKAPVFVYAVLITLSLIFMYLLVETRKTGIFYKEIGVNFDGPFSRPELVYGGGFYISITYIVVISVVSCVFCLIKYRTGSPLEKRRLRYVIYAVVFCWLPYVFKLTGLTGGYEIPALGVVAAAISMYLCLNRLGFLDSVMLAGTNAMDHSIEGILVVDSHYVLQYENKRIEEVFGILPENASLLEHETLGPVLGSEKQTLTIGDRIYDFTREPLKEREYVQGYMLWMIDNTEHYRSVEKMRELAIRDSLTGLYNRNHFQQLVDADIEDGIGGTMIMIDMDNFKQVNDRNGHQCGDAVLVALGDLMRSIPDSRLYSCRLGGDEFCGFLRGTEKNEEIKEVLDRLMADFDRKIEKLGLEGMTGLSIGAVSCQRVETAGFKKLYSETDKVLYEAKMSGKKRYVIKGS